MLRLCWVALALAPALASEALEPLDQDNECEDEGDGEAACSLSALQLSGRKASTARALDDDHGAPQAQHYMEVFAAWQKELEEVHNLTVPTDVTTYDGIEWPIPLAATPLAAGRAGGGSVHIFAVGDWGALLPNHYTAPNFRHHKKCPQECGYVYGIDDKAQTLVAQQMLKRADNSKPQYVLNVGDNFYYAGLPWNCGSGAGAAGQFASGWQSMYGHLTNIPWLSVLGNHDYGGYMFTRGWDSQIKYSFSNPNWVMPARYFMQTMDHGSFSVDYFMLDSNAFDAQYPDQDPDHNICSKVHNKPGASCASAGGPTSVDDCNSWFWSSYRAQQKWLEGKLAASTADWQVVVTHFPCGHDSGWYTHLHKHLGLDLLVTGHRHDQELWANSGSLGGMTCFVTGGGGGITSENPPMGTGASGQYGFFDLTISKEKLIVESINLDGAVIGSAVVYPS